MDMNGSDMYGGSVPLHSDQRDRSLLPSAHGNIKAEEESSYNSSQYNHTGARPKTRPTQHFTNTETNGNISQIETDVNLKSGVASNDANMEPKSVSNQQHIAQIIASPIRSNHNDRMVTAEPINAVENNSYPYYSPYYQPIYRHDQFSSEYPSVRPAYAETRSNPFETTFNNDNSPPLSNSSNGSRFSPAANSSTQIPAQNTSLQVTPSPDNSPPEPLNSSRSQPSNEANDATTPQGIYHVESPIRTSFSDRLPTTAYHWMKRDDNSTVSSSTSRGNREVRTRTRDKYRVVYNEKQRFELEQEYVSGHYITIKRKVELAENLQLSERQIKIWFQNRRAKDRKQTASKKRKNNGLVSPEQGMQALDPNGLENINHHFMVNEQQRNGRILQQQMQGSPNYLLQEPENPLLHPNAVQFEPHHIQHPIYCPEYGDNPSASDRLPNAMNHQQNPHHPNNLFSHENPNHANPHSLSGSSWSQMYSVIPPHHQYPHGSYNHHFLNPAAQFIEMAHEANQQYRHHGRAGRNSLESMMYHHHLTESQGYGGSYSAIPSLENDTMMSTEHQNKNVKSESSDIKSKTL